MRWQHGRRSGNIENRQRAGGGKTVAGGGGVLLGLALVVFLLGGDPTQLVSEGIERTIESKVGGQESSLSEAENAEMVEFVSVILGSTEDIWAAEFQKSGQSYPRPKLVLFTGRVQSACGLAGSATGPFYCPPDQKIYIDLSFFNDLKNDLNAPGDFAQAYVIAHEVGHHIQNITGVIPKVNKMKRRLGRKASNALQVKVELQCV